MLRHDAEHNRERLVQVAGDAFAARGLGVPLTTIARRAGVGLATLYRRFPTRASLVDEVFRRRLAICSELIDSALNNPDPWTGLVSVIEAVAAVQAESGALLNGLLAVPSAGPLSTSSSGSRTGSACSCDVQPKPVTFAKASATTTSS